MKNSSPINLNLCQTWLFQKILVVSFVIVSAVYSEAELRVLSVQQKRSVILVLIVAKNVNPRRYKIFHFEHVSHVWISHILCVKLRELTLLQLTYYLQPYFLLQHLGVPSGQMSKAPRSYHYWSESFFWSRKFSVCPSKSTSIHITTYNENIEFETI